MAMTTKTAAKEIKIGDRVVFHGQWPWHDYYAVVTGEDLNYEELKGFKKTPAWVVVWERNSVDERADTESRIPKYLSLEKFHAVKGGK